MKNLCLLVLLSSAVYAQAPKMEKKIEKRIEKKTYLENLRSKLQNYRGPVTRL